ncbi:D-alanyl-D-alanine carboxypeptidase [bacterium]|nr:D-alanyl-D-alanine carboxypeptidase [bacterium]
MPELITKNIKLLLAAILLSLPFWWFVNDFQKNAENFLYFKILSSKKPIILTAHLNSSLVLKSEALRPKKRIVPVIEESLVSNTPATAFLSYLVKERGKGELLFSKGANRKLPIASLTKLMTAFTAEDIYPSSTRIKISKGAVATEGNAGGLRPGEVFKMKDLIKIMLIESSNDAAQALTAPVGTKAFTHLMNLEAKNLGLQNTHFVNPTGLGTENGDNVSTVEDLEKLVEYLIFHKPDILRASAIKETRVRSESGLWHHLGNTNILLEKYPNIIGSKTGYTNKAKGCLITVLKDTIHKSFIINIVLGSKNRFKAMEDLIEGVYKYEGID